MAAIMRTWRILRCIGAGACVLVVAGPAAATSDLQPPHWDAAVRLPEAVDRNPDPRILEINLEARLAEVEIAPGQRVNAWTYDGGLPGPLIRLRVGDRLIVHFVNRLPQPTTVHWHGVRVPIGMDGVPGSSQPEVMPGESFVYSFIVPDAGLFWYHPHVMSAAQVGFGLYGALLVEDPAEHVGVSDELVMVLSDIAIDDTGQLEDPESGGTAGMAFGREGETVLVNGRTHRRMEARAGVPQRWRIVNAAKSRYFNLDFDGQPFVRIGGDGGLQEYSEQTPAIVLGPGERTDVIVVPKGAPGTETILRSYTYNRGYGSVEFRPLDEILATVVIADLPEMHLPRLPVVARSIAPIDPANATEVTIALTIEQRPDGEFRYGINGVPFATGKPLRARPGETQVWTLINETAWSHPFHLHGFFFQVLDRQGTPVRPLEWKDTVNVPFKETVRIVVRFDEDRPGSWMFHCHVLDHADGGLMGTLELGAPAAGSTEGHTHPAGR